MKGMAVSGDGELYGDIGRIPQQPGQWRFNSWGHRWGCKHPGTCSLPCRAQGDLGPKAGPSLDASFSLSGLEMRLLPGRWAWCVQRKHLSPGPGKDTGKLQRDTAHEEEQGPARCTRMIRNP